jgi:SAM-dependent methyltransferase
VEDWFGYDFRGKRVLIVGAATGAEFFALARRGAAVYGIDVNREAISILRLKARARAVPPTGCVAAAEALPFAENAFDFVYCYTVLEHVAHVEQAIDEMIRVCRVSGFVFIHTPDYRFPFEGHYKVPLIPFAPRFAQALYLRLRGRPTRFLKGINFLTVAKLNRILWQRNVITFRAWSPEIAEWRASGDRLRAWFADTFAVQKHQQILLKKRPADRRPGRARRT